MDYINCLLRVGLGQWKALHEIREIIKVRIFISFFLPPGSPWVDCVSLSKAAALLRESFPYKHCSEFPYLGPLFTTPGLEMVQPLLTLVGYCTIPY